MACGRPGCVFGCGCLALPLPLFVAFASGRRMRLRCLVHQQQQQQQQQQRWPTPLVLRVVPARIILRQCDAGFSDLYSCCTVAECECAEAASCAIWLATIAH